MVCEKLAYQSSGSIRKDDLRAGGDGEDVLPVGRDRKVDGREEAREGRFVVGPSCGDQGPEPDLFGVVRNLRHVVAGPEAKARECGLERVGSGPAEPCADDFECHDP